MYNKHKKYPKKNAKQKTHDEKISLTKEFRNFLC
jgi:hypothetical protein